MLEQTLKTHILLKNILLILFLEREEGWEKERDRNINVWLLLMHLLLGTWPATHAWALTGNRTSNTLVRRLELNLLSHTTHDKKSHSYKSIMLQMKKNKKHWSKFTCPRPHSYLLTMPVLKLNSVNSVQCPFHYNSLSLAYMYI